MRKWVWIWAAAPLASVSVFGQTTYSVQDRGYDLGDSDSVRYSVRAPDFGHFESADYAPLDVLYDGSDYYNFSYVGGEYASDLNADGFACEGQIRSHKATAGFSSKTHAVFRVVFEVDDVRVLDLSAHVTPRTNDPEGKEYQSLSVDPYPFSMEMCLRNDEGGPVILTHDFYENNQEVWDNWDWEHWNWETDPYPPAINEYPVAHWVVVLQPGQTYELEFTASCSSPFTSAFETKLLFGIDAAVEPPAPADLIVNGFVDAEDLAELLNEWGKAESKADINKDGIVDAADLANLLNSWTP